MHTHAQISEEDYHKEKLLLLPVATRCHVVEQVQPESDVAVFIGRACVSKKHLCVVVWLWSRNSVDENPIWGEPCSIFLGQGKAGG